MECLSDLDRVLGDTRIYFSQTRPTGERRRTDQVEAGAKLQGEPSNHDQDLPEWHPFAVWHRHVLSQR